MLAFIRKPGKFEGLRRGDVFVDQHFSVPGVQAQKVGALAEPIGLPHPNFLRKLLHGKPWKAHSSMRAPVGFGLLDGVQVLEW
jgi:hypothetical protein